MIAEFIANYKELTVVGVFSITMAWYLWFTARCQNVRELKRDEKQTINENKRDERQAKREDKVLDMLAVSMKNLEIHTIKNKELNKKIASIQKETLEELKRYKKESREANKILTGVLNNLLKLSNGGNPVVKKLTDDVNKIFEILRKE